MCFFPVENKKYKSKAYKNGFRELSCGKCPECLNKRANEWALRSTAQAREYGKVSMVCLTYDDYKYDENGNIIGENVASRRVCKVDCQKFIKRLREYYARVFGITEIKYLITAEYGKKTGRPHYHALLFGVEFPDLIPYKKSKRGNQIYKSALLTKLWKHGICTVDSVNCSSAVARYCTKYAVKDTGADDTFMLVSHGVGVNELLRTFNGLSYWLDGREYPIPRIVWQKFIASRYAKGWQARKRIKTDMPTYLYKNIDTTCTFYMPFFKRPFVVPRPITREVLIEHRRNSHAREIFRNFRDRNPLYKRYIEYWKRKAETDTRPKDVIKRLELLDDKKYHNYKTEAKKWLTYYHSAGYSKSCNAKRPRHEKPYYYPRKDVIQMYKDRHLPSPSRLLRASDRKKAPYFILGDEVVFENEKIQRKYRENVQLDIDNFGKMLYD